VNTQLNIVTCPTYPDTFIRGNVFAPFVPTFGCNCHTAMSIGQYLYRIFRFFYDIL